ncbi:NTF2-like protein [Ramaria rubella]|nr:NTF2-like protein [Ramaria rubella]
MTDINAISKQFTEFYYAAFDGGAKEQLRALYRPGSMLSWEGTPYQGVDAIMGQLTSENLSKVVHKISTTDAQPSSPPSPNLVVLVTGQLIVDQNPIQFTQLFHLINEGGSYYVLNDVFRLVYG